MGSRFFGKAALFLPLFSLGLFLFGAPNNLSSAENWTPANRVALVRKIGLPLPKNGPIYVVAHRGVHVGIPENTIPAYRKAAELGVDFVEIDVRVTKDGRLVSCHNATIDKYVPGKTGKISQFTLAELKKIDVGSRVGPQWQGTTIPTLDEIFKTVQGHCGIYFDLKETPIPQLVEMVRRYGMEKRVLWYSPFLRVAMFNRLRRLCPDCLPMPDPGPGWLLPLTLKMLHPPVVASVWDDFSRDFAEKCHEAGALVIVDEDKGGPAEWGKMLEWGVDGIQTDDPEGLIRFLKSRSGHLNRAK